MKVNEESVILKTFKSPLVSTFLQPDVDSVKFYPSTSYLVAPISQNDLRAEKNTPFIKDIQYFDN